MTQFKMTRRESEEVARKVARALYETLDIAREDREGPGVPVGSEELRKFIQKELKSWTRLEEEHGNHV